MVTALCLIGVVMCSVCYSIPVGDETRNIYDKGTNFVSSELFRPHAIKKKGGVLNEGARTDQLHALEEILSMAWMKTPNKEPVLKIEDENGYYAPPQLQFLEPNLGPAILPFKIPEGYFVPFIPRKAFGVVNGVSRPPHGHASFYQHRPRGLVDVINSPAYGFLLGGTKL